MREPKISAIFLKDSDGNDCGDLSVAAGTLLSANMTLEINGEHSISLTTQRRLEVGTYAYTRHIRANGRDRIREWVVDEGDQEHSSGKHSTGTYHLIWSLQYELQGTRANDVQQPGMANVNGCDASTAMRAAFSGVMGWETNSDLDTKAKCIMAFDSAWDRLNTVVKYWGGNVDDEIDMNNEGKVIRRVCRLLKHQGDTEPIRRLEWGHDMTSIDRSVDAGPYYCRVIPYGKGESLLSDDGETSYEQPLRLTDGGYARDYIANTMAEQAFRHMTPSGYYYPTTSVSYDTDDPFVLFEMAVQDGEDLTTPNVSYSATISQFAEVGMNVDDIELGDEVQVVDVDFWKDFGVEDAEPLRTQERVVRLEVDLLGVEDEHMEVGKLKQTLERLMSGMVSAVGSQAVATQLSPYVASPYSYELPQHDLYTIDTPEGEIPISYDVPSYEPASYDDRISDLETIISGLVDYEPGVDVEDYDPETGESSSGSNLFGTGSLTTGKLTAGGGGGDQWIHQIDGVTYSTGVVNFVTTKQSTTPSTPSVSPSAPSTPSTPSSSTSQKTTKTDRKTAQQEQNALRNVKTRTGKDVKSSNESGSGTGTSEVKQKKTVAITAANINGNKTIDLNDPWKSSAASSGELVDPGKFILDALDNLFSGGNSGGHSF